MKCMVYLYDRNTQRVLYQARSLAPSRKKKARQFSSPGGGTKETLYSVRTRPRV